MLDFAPSKPGSWARTALPTSPLLLTLGLGLVRAFIHAAEGLPPFAVVESPRVALIVKLAKNAPLAYRPPDRKAVGGWRGGRPQPPLRPNWAITISIAVAMLPCMGCAADSEFGTTSENTQSRGDWHPARIIADAGSQDCKKKRGK